jgi:hypothetical protein
MPPVATAVNFGGSVENSESYSLPDAQLIF